MKNKLSKRVKGTPAAEPTPLGMGLPEAIPHSGWQGEGPAQSRLAAKHFPRPSHPDRSDSAEDAPMSQIGEGPVTPHSGGSDDMPGSRAEGTGTYALNRKPKLRTAMEPTPHGLDMPNPVKHSDHTVRTKSIGDNQAKKWTARNYQMPGPEEGEGD